MKNMNVFAIIYPYFDHFKPVCRMYRLYTTPDPQPNPNSDPTYTIKFEDNSGSPVPDPQPVTHGTKVAMPPAMTKTGYGFGGWYKWV